MITRNEVQNLAKSFRYAFHGIAYCIVNERNMRIHLSAVVLVSFFAYYFGLDGTRLALLWLCFGFVISAEAVNTAIEALVNLESPAYHHLARIAKDVAAGAVAVAALISVGVGLILFWNPRQLLETVQLIFGNPLRCTAAAALLFTAILFIFNGPKLFGTRKSGR